MRLGMITLGRKGSGGLFSLELAKKMQEKVEISVVISQFANHVDLWQASGIQHLAIPTYHNLFEAFITFIYPQHIRELARYIQEKQPQVLLFPIFHPWSPFIQWNLRNIPSVVTVHDPEPHPGDFEWILENLSIKQADRCVILSKSLKSTLVKRGVLEDRIDVIPHGPLFYPSGKIQKDRSKTNEEKAIILFFGRILPYKGLDILIKAFKEVRKTHPAQLNIVGEGDLELYTPLLNNLLDVNIVNRWIPDDEVGEWFEQATVVVLPYTIATQSGIVGIAASYKLPVIATRTGGLPDQIQDEQTGLLVEPGSSHDLADAIIRILDDPDFATDLSQSLQNKFVMNDNWENISSQYLETCQRAFSGRNK
jgi:glycosyltransferase involved in cell wall biosynthesis